MLTPRENAIFRPLVSRAWRAHCARSGTAPADSIAHNHWYRRLLMDAAGLYTTKEIPGGHGDPRFAAICLAAATTAGDDQAIAYWSRDAERRAVWRLRQLQSRLRIDDAYVRAIAQRMNLLPPLPPPNWLSDLPAEHIRRLSAALSMSARRHRAPTAEEVPF